MTTTDKAARLYVKAKRARPQKKPRAMPAAMFSDDTVPQEPAKPAGKPKPKEPAPKKAEGEPFKEGTKRRLAYDGLTSKGGMTLDPAVDVLGRRRPVCSS